MIPSICAIKSRVKASFRRSKENWNAEWTKMKKKKQRGKKVNCIFIFICIDLLIYVTLIEVYYHWYQTNKSAFPQQFELSFSSISVWSVLCSRIDDVLLWDCLSMRLACFFVVVVVVQCIQMNISSISAFDRLTHRIVLIDRCFSIGIHIFYGVFLFTYHENWFSIPFDLIWEQVSTSWSRRYFFLLHPSTKTKRSAESPKLFWNRSRDRFLFFRFHSFSFSHVEKKKYIFWYICSQSRESRGKMNDIKTVCFEVHFVTSFFRFDADAVADLSF